MRRLTVLLPLLAVLIGCSIPKTSVRSGGVVVIELVAPRAFRIDGHLFFESDLEEALRSTHNPEIQRYELRVPYSLLRQGDGRDGCGSLAQVMIAARIPWKAFAWSPGDETTLKEIYCETVILMG